MILNLMFLKMRKSTGEEMLVFEPHTDVHVYRKFNEIIQVNCITWELCWGTLPLFIRQSCIFETFSSIVAPKWRDSKPPPEKLEIDIQGSGTLLCDAVGDPTPAFTWYKDGVRLISK